MNIKGKNWLKEIIELANKGMTARISKNEEKMIISKSLKIKNIVQKMKRFNIQKLENLDEHGVKELKNLFNLIWIEGVKKAKITKIFHKVFPDLIPLIDGSVANLYNEKIDNIDLLIRITKKIKQDLKINLCSLKRLKEELENKEINSSCLRIFDILVWIKVKDSKNLLFKEVY